MTFNNGTYDLSVSRNDGTTFTQNLAILGTDVNVTGGTYDINTGVVTFTTNSGGTFGVTGFTSGMTDSYTTTANTVGNEIQFDNNVLGSNIYSVDLSSILTWSNVLAQGNTSGGSDAVLSTGDVLKAAAGDSSVNLRAYGTDSNVLIGTGPGNDNFAGTALYMSPIYGGLYWSDTAQTNSNYVQFSSAQALFQATNNGVLNEVVLQNGGGTGSSFSENSVQITSQSGHITLSAGSEQIFILNDIPLDNSLTTVLARHPGVSGALREVSVSALTGDIFVTGGTYDGDGEQIVFTNNDAGTFNVDLSALDLNDTYTTGSTLVGSDLYFSNQDTLSAYTVDLSPLLDDTNFYTTGATLVGDTAYFDRTDTLSAFTLDLSSLDVGDTYVTGGTYDNGTASITFTNNDAGTFQVDMSAMDLNDTYVTGGTVSSGALELDLNDGSNVNVTGDIVQTITPVSPLTASTVAGVVTIGIENNTLPINTPTQSNKSQTPAVTTGDNSTTSLTMVEDPSNFSYVGVQINGVSYSVETTSALDGAAGGKDCYFTDTPGGNTSIAMNSITVGSTLMWNGGNVGFELDANDRVDILYNVVY